MQIEALRRKIELYNIHPLAKLFKDKLIYIPRIHRKYKRLFDYDHRFELVFNLDTGYITKYQE